MAAASREALSGLRTQLATVVGGFGSTDGMPELAGELYAVADLLTGQPQLRRRLADPAARPDKRAGLADTLLKDRISANALTLVNSAVSQRWSNAWDLVDGIETSGDDVLLSAATKDGVIDGVEDELFRLERILDSESGLTTLLDEATVSGDTRAGLLDGLIRDKVHPLTLALVRQAVRTERKRSILLAIDDLIDAAGSRRAHWVARVVSAVELSDQQQGNLAEKLTRIYGRPIDVRYAVDPSIRGGLVVRVGDEVIDGSIAARLADAHNAFAS